MGRKIRLIGVFAALGLVVGACGDDDDSASPSEDSVPSTDDSVPSTDDSVPSTEPSPTEGAESTSDPSSGTDDATGEPAECSPESAGGELVFSARNEPPGLDPITSGTTGSLAGHERIALFDAIMQYDRDSGQYEPRMAESLESNEDMTEWTLTLRDDVTFGNGEPVDTDAVEFTVDRHRAEDSTSLSRATASLVESMEIVDDRTMVFSLSSPWGTFPSLLAGPVGMVAHPETFEELGAEAFAADPQGGAAGPFRVERWSPGEELVLAGRDDYWGGPVCLDTVTFSYGLDDLARYQAFQNGEVDVAILRDVDAIAEADADGVSSYLEITNGGFFVQINHGARDAERPGEDLRVRQAIAYAIDAELIDQRAFSGAGLPDTALVPESSLLYSEGLEGPPYDPDQARTLLEEAKAEGYDGSIHFLCNQTYDDAAIAITGLLEDVGFDVNVDAAMSVQDFATRLVETDYDIACGSIGARDARPWDSMAALFSGVDSPASLTGYDSPAMVEAMDALKAAGTPEDLSEAFVDVQQVWNEEFPGAVYGHAQELVIWSDEVEGIDFTYDFVSILDQAQISS